ncbi:sulfurtransferase [Vreelandella sulfidaeris]|uniref:sulfurtransferase n=1 Tax=Vreelandella sulfidaeris TaxID=115553 RepID=UPI0019D4B262|nr:rhodanese-like domain-containing protein [Halomonas sulfidaeris]
MDVRSSIDNGVNEDSFREARIPGSRYTRYTDDAGWQQQGYDVATGDPDAFDATNFEASLRDQLVASTEEVDAAREEQAQLVDARPSDYFSGENKSPAARVAGTIPGARSLPHQSHLNVQNGAYYLDVDGLQSRINQADLDRRERTIAFCNTGHWAATDWFVLSEVAGFENIAMYDGSMAAWTISDSRPVQLAREGIIRCVSCLIKRSSPMPGGLMQVFFWWRKSAYSKRYSQYGTLGS